MKKGTVLFIPEGTKSIQVLQYTKDMELTEAYVPEGVRVIHPKAFCKCTNLRTVHLPRSLTHSDMKVFEECPLGDIYYAGTREQWREIEISPVLSQSIILARKHFLGEAEGETVEDPTAEVMTENPGFSKAEAEKLLLAGGGQIDPVKLGQDHGEEILEQVRRIWAQGGDGRFHIVVPYLGMEGVYRKPGDSQLLIFPQGSTMIVDTGFLENWPRVQAFFEAVELKRLDYFVLTHSHKDHVGNSMAIARWLYDRSGEVGHLWWTGQQFGDIVPALAKYLTEKGAKADLAVRVGREFSVDGVKIQVLGPTDEEMEELSMPVEVCNNQSMILKMNYGHTGYIMAGDLYADHEEKVAAHWGETLRADIVNTNHHGNFTSNSKTWQAAVDGKLYFTCSVDNGCTQLAEELEARGVEYYSTGCQGILMISADAEGEYQVKTQYDRGMKCIQRVNG